MIRGVLTEDEASGKRVGTILSPTEDKLVALACIFGVEAGTSWTG